MIKSLTILTTIFIVSIFIFNEYNTKNIFVESSALSTNKNNTIENIIREHKSLGNNVVLFSLSNQNTRFNKKSTFYINSDEMSSHLQNRGIKYTLIVNDVHETKTENILKLEDESFNKIIINNDKRNKIKIEIDKNKIKLIDGDSLFYDSKEYRLLGFDAPEARQEFGTTSENYLKSLITNADKIYISVSEYDIYSRILAHLFINDTPVAYYMILSRMGIQTITKYGDNGFPIISENILILARRQGRLPFLNPSVYRKRAKENPKTKSKYKPIVLLNEKDVKFIYNEKGKIESIITNN